ncbi:hypothetical protein SPRG_00849 [Saprolegnia parasitica CBS 223.65]|uniref:Fungal lipase-type domain-containing protein n=1 Tax=Saprolegnia parasitica (strain CBS 223.65) TaxID=695850 RepID=A0A067CWC2_SAPPC|nr:hypothetical protein SPRG_00849 [Saprolegnia parasitica CBS 223.65]KDO34788.1 hypothetical protein SPRG_00849 [Saprolegnia parasitica CBS 223.65]|eukprot:XP_012194455.1 hypothetical protein SPRG_00849 [Saprolegnia parasitica CBS 223.65]
MERGLDMDDVVHRPLLFATRGYASSQLLLDDAQRKRRHRNDADDDGRLEDAYLHGPSAPRLRLETLGSRAATIVLAASYVSFCVALVMAYLYSDAYLRTTINLPGDVCQPTTPIDTPCTYIDYHTANAWYAANVSNVSWLAGSMQLSILPANLTQHEPSFVLEYDVSVYGGRFPFTEHGAHKPIFSLANQSLWLHCAEIACDAAPLFDISQANEGLGGNGYGSYLVLVVFDGYYPHLFARDVQYAFSYTKPAVVVSQLVVRTALLLLSLGALPYWVRAVPSPRLRIQSQLFWVLCVLVLWQNPVFVVAQWFGDVSNATRLSANVVQAWANACFRGLWLFMLGHPASVATRVWPKVLFVLLFGSLQTSQSILRLPSLSPGHEPEAETAYIALGISLLLLNWYWLAWVVQTALETAATLQTFVYMLSRHEQLSFRFLLFESVLLLVQLLLASLVHAGQLIAAVVSAEGSASMASLRRACIVVLGAMGNDMPQLSFVIFFAVFVSLMLWVHLPAPPITATSSLFQSTAFYVHEKHQHDGHVFCLETAEWLVQLAWQAYFDPVGNPSSSGAGVQTLETFGFELIAHLRHDLVDTHALVCINRETQQLVVAFRGSVSKAHWKTNLRFHQVPLWMHAMGARGKHRRRRSCKERLQLCAGRIPLLNLALPRVHSGFWKAYAAVRDDLKETLRLVLQDDPYLHVYVTGHSMGGALAVLAAYDIAAHFAASRVSMYNFGGPRVGNPAFVRQYNRTVPESFRVVFDGDLVAGIPRFWGLYEHVGREVSIDGTGNVLLDPSFIERRLLVSSKTKVASHATLVYRNALRLCLDNLRDES